MVFLQRWICLPICRATLNQHALGLVTKTVTTTTRTNTDYTTVHTTCDGDDQQQDDDFDSMDKATGRWGKALVVAHTRVHVLLRRPRTGVGCALLLWEAIVSEWQAVASPSAL